MRKITGLLAWLIAGAGLVASVDAKVVWQEDFESARCLLDWEQTVAGKPSRKAFLRTDTIARAGKMSGMVYSEYHAENTQVYIQRPLPENRGGVLTVWVYDPGYEYSGINAHVMVYDQKDRESHLMLNCGHFEFIANNKLLYASREPFLYRRDPLQWYCFQFVLNPAEDGRIKCYIDGRLAAVSAWRDSQSFKSLKLGAHMLRGRVFYDAITLDDDPAAFEIFKGCDLQMRVPRPGCVVYDDDADIPAAVKFRNYTGRDLQASLSGNVVDDDRKVWGEITPVPVTIKAGDDVAEMSATYPVPPRKGRFYLQAFLKDGDKIIGQTRRPVAVTFNPESTAQFDSPFGIQGRRVSRIGGWKYIGARSYNLILSWPNSEPAPDKLEWDKELEQDIRLGVDNPGAFIMLNFGALPKWRQAGGDWNQAVPKNDKDLEDFGRQAAKYYRDAFKVNTWSYCEEPSAYFPWPRYLEMFQAAVTGLRAGNPDAKIVGLNAVTADFSFDEWMFQHGAGDFMDIYGHHFYVNGRPEDYGLVEKLDLLKGFMRQYNGGKILPMWDTECGMYVGGLGQGLIPLTSDQMRQYKARGWYADYYFADADVANYTVRKMVLGYANGLTKYFFHKSLRIFDDTCTLTALAVSALCHEMSGAVFVKPIEFPGDNLHGYVFARDGKHFAVLWTARDTADVTLKLEQPAYREMDRYGNRTARTAGAGNLVNLTLTEEPVYLLDISENIDRQPDALSLHCPDKVETPSFDVVMEALPGTDLAGIMTLKLPDGWTSQPETMVCDFSRSNRISMAVNVPWGLFKGDRIITANLNDQSGKRLFSAQGTVTLAIPAPCRRLVKPVGLDGNLDDWPDEFKTLAVDRLEQVVIGRPAIEDTQSLAHQIAQGSRFWKGADDFSASIKTAWDDDNLYIGIRVRDNALHNDFMRNPYKGDSIELFLDTRAAGQDLGKPVYADGVYHLRFVPPVGGAAEGRQVGYFQKHEDKLLKRRPEFIVKSDETVYSEGEAHLRDREIPAYAAGNRFVFTPAADGYNVELAIPFAVFQNGRPGVGETFGFDIMFNDQDYPQERAAVALCWHGDGKNSTTPSVFGRLRLAE